MALITGQPRVATLTAVQDSRLQRLSKGAFERLTAQYPLLAPAFSKLLTSRLQRTQLGGILQNLFGELDAAAIKAIQKWEFEPVIENGEVIEKRAGVRLMFALE